MRQHPHPAVLHPPRHTARGGAPAEVLQEASQGGTTIYIHGLYPPLQVCQTLVSTKPKVVTAQVPREVCGHLDLVRAPAPGPARTHLDTAARRSHPAPAPGAGQHRRHPAGPEEASSQAAAFRDSPIPLPGDTRGQELGNAEAEWSKDQRDLLYYFMMNGQKYE